MHKSKHTVTIPYQELCNSQIDHSYEFGKRIESHVKIIASIECMIF